MTIQRIRTHSEEVREEALRLWSEGVPVRSIASRLNVPFEAARYWIEKADQAIPTKVRTKTTSGSGVIAPPAYRRGYRWGAGW